MTVEKALSWLKEHRNELISNIWEEKYKPTSIRGKPFLNPDGGERKFGIPTVTYWVIQQAMDQRLQSIYEPLFSNSSLGYRPNRSMIEPPYSNSK